MARIVSQIRDGKDIAAALDDHEVARVFVFGKRESDVVLPAHDEAGAMAYDHVWIAGAFEDEMHIAIAFPRDVDA